MEHAHLRRGPDHVHVVLTGDADGDAIRKWFKRWLGQELAKRYPLEPGQTFWAECGSVKWVWTDEYFARVVKYVSDQRASR
jgi:REP element-mobilizing transposase RayT